MHKGTTRHPQKLGLTPGLYGGHKLLTGLRLRREENMLRGNFNRLPKKPHFVAKTKAAPVLTGTPNVWAPRTRELCGVRWGWFWRDNFSLSYIKVFSREIKKAKSTVKCIWTEQTEPSADVIMRVIFCLKKVETSNGWNQDEDADQDDWEDKLVAGG